MNIRKNSRGGGSFSIHKFILQIFAIIDDTPVMNFGEKKLQYDFPKMRGGQRPFGTFPKIHPFWSCQASLTIIAFSRKGFSSDHINLSLKGKTKNEHCSLNRNTETELTYCIWTVLTQEHLKLEDDIWKDRFPFGGSFYLLVYPEFDPFQIYVLFTLSLGCITKN